VGIAVTSELEVIFDTVKTSRKYANLTQRPSCSFVIGWEGEQTVQFEGIAAVILGNELSPYQEQYFSVWPDGKDHLSWPGITYFVVRPSWIRYSDYGVNPPLIQEFAW
jgi:pyridoxine/pyridoxamine 5'-phosphate oxidase